jgi:hypothetical protein
MLDHKEAIISHLSWASLFLGFHTLGLYVHNDVMFPFLFYSVERKIDRSHIQSYQEQILPIGLKQHSLPSI